MAFVACFVHWSSLTQHPTKFFSRKSLGGETSTEASWRSVSWRLVSWRSVRWRLPQLAQTLFLIGLDPGAERSLRELSILFAEVAKFYSSNTIELVAATPI